MELIEFSGYNPDGKTHEEKFIKIKLDVDTALKLSKKQSLVNVSEIVSEFLSSQKRSIELELEALEEDVARAKGILLAYKAKYKEVMEAQNEQITKIFENLNSDYADKEKRIEILLDKLHEKVNPVLDKTMKIEKALRSFDSYGFEKLQDAITRISNLYGKDREMIEFLINNFNRIKH